MKSSFFLIITFSLLLIMGTIAWSMPPEGLVLYMNFEEDDAATDLSPEHNDGIINGVTLVPSKDGLGMALDFSPGNFVEIVHSESLSMTDVITIMTD